MNVSDVVPLLPAFLEGLLLQALEKIPSTPSGVKSFFFVREPMDEEDDPAEIVVPDFVMPTTAQRSTFYNQLKVKLMERGVTHIAFQPCVWAEGEMWGAMVVWAQSKKQLQNAIDMETAVLEMLENRLN